MAFFTRGFKWRSNSLFLLGMFVTAGLFLHYGGKPQPVLHFWREFSGLFDFDRKGETDLFGGDDSEKEGLLLGNEVDKSAPAAVDLERIIKRRDFFLPAFSKKDQLVRREGYTLNYKEQYEQANWVAYVLKGDQVRGEEARTDEFLNDPAVKSGSALSTDYTRSGYDRGHLAPAGDFRYSYQLMQETFYMSNISPMKAEFNRKGWGDLEKLVRVWAVKYGQVFVVTGPVLENGLSTIGKFNRIAVPREFYKVILYVKPPYIKGVAFVMPNQFIENKLSSYVVSIDEVEKKTGIDFYPMLPDSIENKVEQQSRVSEWYRLR